MTNSVNTFRKPPFPAGLIAVCLYMLALGALTILSICYSLANPEPFNVYGMSGQLHRRIISFLFNAISLFGLLCGVMILCKKSAWIFLARINLGIYTVAMLIKLLQSFLTSDDLIRAHFLSWNIDALVISAIALICFIYLHVSKKTRARFPDAYGYRQKEER